VVNPTPSGIGGSGTSTPSSRRISSKGLPKGSEPSGGSTAGQVSNVPSSASGRWLPVAPSDANITSPAGLAPVTRTWLVRLPGASTSTSTTMSSPGGAVATNWVVIHSACRSVTASAAAIEAAMAVPP
jgi:hypothetical protein